MMNIDNVTDINYRTQAMSKTAGDRRPEENQTASKDRLIRNPEVSSDGHANVSKQKNEIGNELLVNKVEETLQGTLNGKPSRVSLDIDENKNMIFKVYDSDGNLMTQIPPEETLKIAEALKQQTSNLFHTTA